MVIVLEPADEQLAAVVLITGAAGLGSCDELVKDVPVEIQPPLVLVTL